MTPPVKNYTIAEAAQYLRLSERTVYRLKASGQLRVVKIGSRVVIRETALEQLLKRGEK
jgi:excisionase family DNA binding protein